MSSVVIGMESDEIAWQHTLENLTPHGKDSIN